MYNLQSVLVFCVTLSGICIAQQGIDPAYLRQYYQQVAQQGSNGNGESTPIFEQNPEQSQQYSQASGQQIRIKDNVQEQVRAQQNSQPAYVAPSVREYLQQQPQQLQYIAQPQHQQQHQPQPQAYKPAPQKQNRPRPVEYQSAPQGGKYNKLNAEDPEDYDPSPSYQFGFDVKDDEFTNYQNRKESREGNVITGSYSVVDSDGFIRTVKYTADPKEGFKAEVIREPTDIVVKVPTPQPQQHRHSQQNHQAQQQQQQQQHQQQQHQPQQQQYLKQQPQQPQYQQYHQ